MIAGGDSWLNTDEYKGVDNKTITITARANPDPNHERFAIYYISDAAGLSRFIPVTITQSRSAYIKLSVNEIPLGNSSGSDYIFSVYSNIRWYISSTSPWIHLYTSSGENNEVVQIHVDANTSEASRTGILIVRENSPYGSLSDTLTVYQETTTGITEIQNEYNIYPNPVTDNLYITKKSTDGITKINVYSLTGKPLLTKIFTDRTCVLDMSKLKPGCYLLSLETYNRVKNIVVLKMKK